MLNMTTLEALELFDVITSETQTETTLVTDELGRQIYFLPLNGNADETVSRFRKHILYL